MTEVLVFAQSSERFKQRLEWKTDSNVLEYKIEIQNQAGKIIDTITTDQGFVELSLTPGSYRYKIYAYDLLGRESVSTKWIPFEILVANQPAIKHTQTLEGLEEDGKTLELDVNIGGVTQESIVELVSENGKKKIKGKLVISTEESAAGISASETHNAVKAQFNDVPQGNWKLVVTNPSGLSSESESFEVRDVLKEERIAAEKAEKERLAREEKERKEAEKLAKELAKKEEEERIAREKAAKEEAERLAKEKALKEAKEKAFQEELERIAKERAEKEEQKRQEAIKVVEKEIEERVEKERIEKEKIEAQKAEEERIAHEAERREQEEAERLAREEEEAAEREREEQEKEEKRLARLNRDRKFTITPFGGFNACLYENDVFKDLKLNRMSPAFGGRFDYLPVHTKSLRFGLEVNGFYSKFNTENNFLKFNLNMFDIHTDAVLRVGPGKQKKFWIQLKTGAGIYIFNETIDYLGNSVNNKQNVTMNYGYFEAGGGLSFVIIPSRIIAIELGTDFHNVFMQDTFIGFAIPYVGLGFRF